MLRINKVKDKKAESKRKSLAKKGASKEQIAKVKDNLSNALDYFFKKEFTQNEIPKYKENYKNYLGEGVWLGDLAEHMSINRTVKASDFNDLHQSINPETKEQIAKNTGRGFIELVFNCPKDFSMLVALDDEMSAELVDTFNDAVKETMTLIDEQFNYARANNKNKKVKLKGLAYASFMHTTSRPTSNENSVVRPDMHIHSHNLLWTTSLDENGQLRSIEDISIFKNQVFLGTYFRSKLAQSLIKKGYEVVPHTEVVTSKDDRGLEKTEKVKSFAIKQITNEQRLAFSKRKSDIEYLAKKYGANSSMCKDFIAQNFKHRKVKFNSDELTEIWKDDAKEVGIDKEFLKSLRTYNRACVAQNLMTDEDLIRRACIKKGADVKIYETVLMRTLCEYAQYVPIDPQQKFKQLLSDKLLTQESQFTYKANFELNKQSKFDEFFYEQKNNSSKKIRQSFLGKYLYANNSFLIQSEREKNKKESEKNAELKEFSSKKLTSFKEIIESNATKNDIDYSNFYGSFITESIRSNYNISINALYISIESLMKQARNTKLSAIELAQINAQIAQLRLQIEELEKKKKNIAINND